MKNNLHYDGKESLSGPGEECGRGIDAPQRIWVFQQNGSGESKIQGIRKFGGDRFIIEVISVHDALPPVMDETDEYLPEVIEADLVLDFLKHLDISHDLALLCSRGNVPIVASGKKHRIRGGVFTPPT